MKDDYSQNSLREEWSLLLQSFLEDEASQSDLVHKMRVSQLSADRVKSIKKDLSSKRKKLNQAIEKIKIKLEQVTMVIENLKLVGSDTSGLDKEIDFLIHEGEKIFEEILKLDSKIKKIHDLQDLELI
jgi:hypothetical protein